MGSEWCHPLIVTAKANRKIRMCVDFCYLNCHVERPIHHMIRIAEAISCVSISRFSGRADATHGYWETPLEEKSQLTTVFVTPWSRYKYLWALMGLNTSGDEYCYRGDIALDGLATHCKSGR